MEDLQSLQHSICTEVTEDRPCSVWVGLILLEASFIHKYRGAAQITIQNDPCWNAFSNTSLQVFDHCMKIIAEVQCMFY